MQRGRKSKEMVPGEIWARDCGFALKNYMAMPNKDPLWWYEALDWRLDILNVLLTKSKPPRSFLDYAKWRIGIGLRQPLRSRLFDERHEPEEDETNAIHELTVAHLEQLRVKIPPHPDAKNIGFALTKEGGLSVFDVLQKRFKKRLRQCALVVDIRATDDVLQKELPILIRQLRAKAGFTTRRKSSHKGVTASELNNWKTSNVLAYIDLILASKIFKYPLGKRVAARLLFSPPGKPLSSTETWDRFKTTQKHYAKIMRKDFISMLSFQDAVSGKSG